VSTTLKRHQMFVGGQWVDSSGGDDQEIINPANGKVIAHAPKGTAEDVNRAVTAARKAYDEVWFDTTPRERSEALLKLADAILEHGEELAALESENVGKPLATTLSEEIPPTADCFRFFAGAARILEGKSAGEYMKGFTSMIRRESLGVVGSIAPWNYPLMMSAWKLGPALAAGNTGQRDFKKFRAGGRLGRVGRCGQVRKLAASGMAAGGGPASDTIEASGLNASPGSGPNSLASSSPNSRGNGVKPFPVLWSACKPERLCKINPSAIVTIPPDSAVAPAMTPAQPRSTKMIP